MPKGQACILGSRAQPRQANACDLAWLTCRPDLLLHSLGCSNTRCPSPSFEKTVAPAENSAADLNDRGAVLLPVSLPAQARGDFAATRHHRCLCDCRLEGDVLTEVPTVIVGIRFYEARATRVRRPFVQPEASCAIDTRCVYSRPMVSGSGLTRWRSRSEATTLAWNFGNTPNRQM